VKVRRAIELVCRNVEAPLTRAERAASWAIEFMMIAEGIDDGEWRLDIEAAVCPHNFFGANRTKQLYRW
jgi:hypothetical protein